MKQSEQIRNNYIDFLRGIAAIGIIAIHTAFWGGQSYTPEWFCSSYRKKCYLVLLWSGDWKFSKLLCYKCYCIRKLVIKMVCDICCQRGNYYFCRGISGNNL